jgi:hypothetical protein
MTPVSRREGYETTISSETVWRTLLVEATGVEVAFALPSVQPVRYGINTLAGGDMDPEVTSTNPPTPNWLLRLFRPFVGLLLGDEIVPGSRNPVLEESRGVGTGRPGWRLIEVEPGNLGWVFIFAGRFQGWHFGHHDVPRALLNRDASIFPDPRDRELFLRWPVHHLHLCIAELPLDAKNPLSVGCRKLLIEAAIQNDPAIAKFRNQITVGSMPNQAGVAGDSAKFLTTIPKAGIRCFVSGNPFTLAEYEAASIFYMRIQNRKNSLVQSGTALRQLIIEGTSSSMAQAEKLVPAGVFDAMDANHVFEQIRMMAKGG